MKKYKEILKSNPIFSFMYVFDEVKDEDKMTELTEEEYRKQFIVGKLKEKIEASYNQAWQAKNFEIDNYWKRTNYFWAFQVAAFAGYFSVLSSEAYNKNPQVLYIVTCIGFITAIAWSFINRGSKTWQRHWEIHVDMLENEVTGPLYKTVTEKKTFSVSKINEIVSRFITCIWLLLASKYIIQHNANHYSGWRSIDFQVWISSILTLYFVCAMYWGYGRGRFGKRRVSFYLRKYSTKD